jgi:hypothetical protein
VIFNWHYWGIIIVTVHAGPQSPPATDPDTPRAAPPTASPTPPSVPPPAHRPDTSSSPPLILALPDNDGAGAPGATGDLARGCGPTPSGVADTGLTAQSRLSPRARPPPPKMGRPPRPARWGQPNPTLLLQLGYDRQRRANLPASTGRPPLPMRTQLPRQTGTSGPRRLDQELLHSLYLRSRDPSATNYPRFNYLRRSAIQLRQAT